ncbi:M48 family metallopeptidase [Nocardia sp. NRRL S-836]|uniref:M48 family metallopeptidase n=1 Tax=Nocardia sp. NRRL S-836 TaxID=1519492 RepID=UPI0006AF4A3A|nr:M48 family metallopeptidase [Nocardia sp. NRRL S-836]KOV85027.1 hypothetical protein ADL03_11880 [Nocardia sp. NRRL S-836]
MAVRFNLHDLMHPFDRSARSKLEAVPLLDKALTAYGKVYTDRMWRHYLLSNGVRLGPRQLPEIYRMLPPICDALGIEPPELYLMEGAQPNAFAVGIERPMLVLYSRLLDSLDEDEIRAVIAHECGHIAFDHSLYRQIGDLVAHGGVSILPNVLGLKTLGDLAFGEALVNWQHKSELSADRVAAVCTGGPEAMKRAIFHMVGVPKWLPGEINYEEFEAQTVEFDAFKLNSIWNRLIDRDVRIGTPTHPMPIARVKYLQDWARTDAFRILTGTVEHRRDQAPTRCERCQNQLQPTWRFCQTCGTEVVGATGTIALEGP